MRDLQISGWIAGYSSNWYFEYFPDESVYELYNDGPGENDDILRLHREVLSEAKLMNLGNNDPPLYFIYMDKPETVALVLLLINED